MEQFKIASTSKSLFTQVINIKNKYRAMTSLYLIIDGQFIEKAIAQSDAHDNGAIYLDDADNPQFKDLGLANIYYKNELVFITTVYGIPDEIKKDSIKDFIIKTNPMQYTLKQLGNSPSNFVLNEKDRIMLRFPGTATIYKKINIL